MSCRKHLLMFEWDQHAWTRLVTQTEDWTARGTDIWSRAVPVDCATCHIQYVCRHCGAVRDGGACGCDRTRADACPPRLAYLDRNRATHPAASA